LTTFDAGISAISASSSNINPFDPSAVSGSTTSRIYGTPWQASSELLEVIIDFINCKLRSQL
jgi:hypothetical protein